VLPCASVSSITSMTSVASISTLTFLCQIVDTNSTKVYIRWAVSNHRSSQRWEKLCEEVLKSYRDEVELMSILTAFSFAVESITSCISKLK
jgi:hypothetical protein